MRAAAPPRGRGAGLCTLLHSSTPWPHAKTDLAAELIRSKLPTHALAALRLACRAARDDFVDGRCTALRALRRDVDIVPLFAAARRLRRVESVAVPRISEQERDCAGLAAILSRLPGGGAALRELRFNFIACPRLDRPLELTTAVAGLAGLPQLSLPLAGREGAPLGLSLMGPAGSDASLVRLAQRIVGEG